MNSVGEVYYSSFTLPGKLNFLAYISLFFIRCGVPCPSDGSVCTGEARHDAAVCTEAPQDADQVPGQTVAQD